MKTFDTYAQYMASCTDVLQNSYRPPVGPYLWVCDTCGKASPNTDGHGRTDGAMHCYACCDAMARADMLDRSKPFCAYLASDARTVTTWTGGRLGTVSAHTSSRVGWHGAEIHRFHVCDVHGNLWHGRGSGPGMVCTLRAMKG
jgi:hypothetical protein